MSDKDKWDDHAVGGWMTQLVTSPKTIITPLMRYWVEGLLYFFRHMVDRMKKMASQITSLLRVNMPNEHRRREMKLAPSGSSWGWQWAGSKKLILLGSCIQQLQYIIMQPQSHSLRTVVPPAPRTYDRGQPATLEASPTHLLYFNGRTLILRPIDGSSALTLCHAVDIVAAKFSFDYRYVASIDEKGTLKIHEVLPAKFVEFKVYDGFYMGCKGLDWTPDNKRLCAVGSGRNKYGRVILVDTGSDVGDISGVTATLTTACFRPQRPYKLVVGGDEKAVKYFDGPPYKYAGSKTSHTNFINQIKYSPDGNLFVSVSSDRKIVVYDGKSGDVLKELNGAHEAGITGVAWLDDKQFVTVSSDKIIRRWNSDLEPVKSLAITDSEEELGLVDSFITAVSHHPSSSKIYCLCLSGQIKQVEKDLSKVTGSFQGVRRKPIKILQHPTQTNSVIVLESNGKALSLNLDNNRMERYLRQVLCYGKVILDGCIDSSTLYILDSRQVVSAVSLADGKLIQEVAVGNASLLVGGSEGFVCLGTGLIQAYSRGGNDKYVKSWEHKLQFEPVCVHRTDSGDLWMGDAKGEVIVVNGSDSGVVKKAEFKNSGYRVSCISQHNDLFFIGDSMGPIKVWRWDGAEATKVSSDMGSHTTVVTGVVVSEGHIHSFAMDNKHSVWGMEKYNRLTTTDNVHQGGILGALTVGDKLITFGGDYLIKIHSLQ